MQEQELQEQLNKVWNGWRIAGVLGEGSYGKVYRIIREEFGHVYESAMKVISIPQSQSEVQSALAEGMDVESAKTYFYSVVSEIVEEFTLMSKLRGNTNIVSYEDHAVVSGEDKIGWDIFIRMELLTPLPEYFNNNPLSVRRIVQLGIDMCQALELCRRYNIIHRDVKPENIFVSDIGNYKLGDFGIARQMEKTSGNMSKKGTINYMAPEVYKGEKYDATVDIYSLGLVLYRFLNNNRMPFLPPYPQPLLYNDKEKANILRMGGTKLTPPCNAQGRLAEIVLKACAYMPEDRYKTASEMKRDLESVLDGKRRPVEIITPQVKESVSEDIYADSKRTELKQTMTESGVSGKQELSVDAEVSGKQESSVDAEVSGKQELPIGLEASGKQEMPTGAEVPGIQEMPVGTEVSGRYEMPVGAEVYGGNGKTENPNTPVIVDKKRSSGNGKRVAIVVITIILLASGGVFGVNAYKHSKECVVPDYTNKTFEESVKLSEEDDYALVVVSGGEEYSDTVEKGRIISQDIASGDIVSKGSQITVIISKGSLVKAPKLVGVDRSEAEDLMKEVGLTLVIGEEVYSDDVAAGVVISQSIEADTLLEPGKEIAVLISKGKELWAVPNMVGMTLEEAESAANECGIVIETSEEYSDTVDADIIISQDIEAETLIEKGTTVKLVKSLGKKPVVKSTTTKSNNSGSKKNNNSKVIWDEID